MVVIGSCLLLFAALRKKNIIKKAKRKFDGEIILVGLYTGLLFPDPLRHPTVFPRIIARGDYYYFSHNKGTIISNTAHRKSCPKYFVYYPIKSRNDHFQNVSNLVPWLIFNVNTPRGRGLFWIFSSKGGGYARAAIQDRGNDSFQPKTPMNYWLSLQTWL